MIISPIDGQGLAKLAHHLENDDEIIALPTETVYGLAAHVSSHAGIKKIFQVKGRPLTNPLIVHTTSIENMAKLFDLTGIEKYFERLSRFIPGSLTILAPINYSYIKHFINFYNNLHLITAGQAWLCCRVPNHQVFNEFVNKLELPYVVAPSANRSNYVSPTTAEQLELEYDGELTVVDGGVCQHGLESTILKLGCDQAPEVLRYGSIPIEELNECLGLVCRIASKISKETNPDCQITVPSLHKSADKGSNHQIASPGMHRKHYAPKAKVIYPSPNTLPQGRYCYIQLIQQPTTNTRAQCATSSEKFTIAPNPLTKNAELLYQFGESREGRKLLARELYAIFRECDRIGIDTVIIDPVSHNDLGAAINDRILRAMAED